MPHEEWDDHCALARVNDRLMTILERSTNGAPAKEIQEVLQALQAIAQRLIALEARVVTLETKPEPKENA
jgi:uncharacterized protein (UPF0276 family)